MLPWLIHPLAHKFICYYSTEGIESIVAINNGMYGIYNSICSLATTTAAIVVLGD
jgi:hypothetical protein